jgi:hypothetical protein
MTMNLDFSNFTIEAYAALLEKALARYRFVRLGDGSAGDGRALWRHDIDFSPHRALVMAEIEAARVVRASYFVQLTAPFYNTLEPDIGARLRRIADLGHDIGIHCEPLGPEPADRLAFEARTLEAALGVPIRMFSLHNPTTYDTTRFEATEVAGLINASAPQLREAFVYCSDSNGLWRYRSLAEVIADADSHNIYALTHPEWWQDEAMSPRQRVERCIAGRARATSEYYDSLLAAHQRPNVGAPVPFATSGE